jgi:hypothetical protein
MSDFNSGDYKKQPIFSKGNRVSNAPDWRTRNLFQTPGGIRNTQDPILRNIMGSANTQGSVPTVNPLSFGTSPNRFTGMTADAAARRAGEVAPTPEAPVSDPYLDLLYGILEQSQQGSGGANLSGYNASLKMLGKERKRMKARYKKYSNQIADIYGTLTGINTSMIADIAPAGEAMRADLAAQEGQQAAATRSADAARLSAATAARAELGLEDIASQYAGGDVATTQAEGVVTDTAARNTAAENTLLANEAIAKQQLTNQNLGYGIQQEASATGLQRSLEDALAAIRAERVNVINQRAQASSQGSGPNVGAQLEILDRIQSYTNPSVKGEPTPLDILESRNPNLGNAGRQAADTFAEWISNTANYEAIPAVKLGNKPSAAQVVGAFLTQTGQNVPAAQTWARNMDIYNLLVSLANTAK